MPDLTYPSIQALIARQMKRHTTESRAFLAWVLENIYRLEDAEADDCVCDGPDDKGVDGLYANMTSETVEIFQSKLYQKTTRTVGDAALRDFAGTLTQFKDPESIIKLRDSTRNHELRGRIDELKLANIVAQGYEVKGVFVTNVEIDSNGREFLTRAEDIITLSKAEIESLYVPAERTRPETGTFQFDVSRYDFITYTNPQGVSVAIAPISATQLIELPGIDSGALFEPNLRQSLGRTKVNKEIVQSIDDVSEHGQFLLYHNGITMVCESLTEDKQNGKLVADNLYVVNGCQSLSSLFARKSEITDDLFVLVKIVVVGEDSELLDKITYRSNNQNVIKPRDFKSNHPIQTRLQNEFLNVFNGKVFYEIKRGEISDAEVVIENDLAARILLSFDLGQPYTAHQSYKLFDELYTDIFSRPEVNAGRIFATHFIYQKVVECVGNINDTAFANYTLTKFFLLHIIAEALRTTDGGKEFIRRPGQYLFQEKGLEVLDRCIDDMLSDLVTDLNGELEERVRNGQPLDFKRELKNSTAVGTLTRAVVGSYQKLVSRGRVESFDDEWSRVKTELTADAASSPT
ncbi:MAG: AIPR family protein [Proteobacteria bacterium]|nr:AIPR family protein [Pseudomonadota bacterium]